MASNPCEQSEDSFEFADVWPEHPFIVAWRRSLERLGIIASTHGLELWFVAARLRREFEAQTSRVGLSLTQWLVLEATRQIIEEQRDATSQKRVAERLDMNKMTLSQVMRGLEERGLVDRGPCYESPELRVWVTEHGAEVLRRAREVFGGAPRSAPESRGAAE